MCDYSRPKNLLIFYGWMNSFNSTQNGWNNEKVAKDMCKYDLIVLGDGIQLSSHGDYSNTTTIIERIQELKPSVKIFGYVTTNQTDTNWKAKVESWDNLEVDGIFMDECGYDYGNVSTNGRDAINAKVAYIHSLDYATSCFVNAWNLDHIFGTDNDASYPNSTWNDCLHDTILCEDDWFLLESFPINGTTYRSKSETIIRAENALLNRSIYGVNMAAVSVIANSANVSLFDFSFTCSLLFSLDAHGSSDTNYGASSATVKYFTRPDVSKIGDVYSRDPVVKEDGIDSDKLLRYTNMAELYIDFSDDQESSDITIF